MADKECPLCHSLLSESKYNEVVKITEENLKKENELKRQLHSVKEAKDKLEIEKKNIEKNYKIRLEKDKEQIKRDFEKQKSSLIKKAQEDAKKLAKKDIDKANKEKLESERGLKKKIVLAQKEFLEKGKEFEKRRSEKLTNSLKHITDERNKLFDRTRELEKQLKEAKTPQQEGFDFEKELANELQKTFKNDKIVPKGHGGDIFHHIIHDNKEIALIIYECKKTQKHSQSHIKQIRNDVINNKAKYGILVTFASDKNKSGFWIEKDILVVHPHGARYIAEVLRNSLMELYSHKLNDKEIGERAKKLLDYIKSNKFRNSVKDNILRSIELQKMLDLEKDYHETLWKKRGEHYQSIAQKSSEIEKESKSIVGEDSNEQIIEIEINPPRKKKKIEDLNY